MPSVTWTHAGSPHTTINLAFSGTVTPANWVTAINAWIATTNENGDSGTVNCATAPSAAGIFVDLQNTGSIPADATLTTMQMQFDYAITNGPMGGGVAESDLSTSIGIGAIHSGAGASSGSYNQTNDTTTIMGSTVPADLYTNGPYGFAYSPTNTGVFAAHNRRIAVSNFSITVSYNVANPPAIVSITPSTGPVAGGNTVTLRGTGFTGATGLTVDGVSTAFTLIDDGTITFVAPAHAAAPVTVTLTGLGLSTGYTYSLQPQLLPPIPVRSPLVYP